MSVKMIDITSKEPVYREAVARGFLKVDEDTMSDLINNGVSGLRKLLSRLTASRYSP